MASYTVQPGDTLTSIAQRHGIASWQKLYNDPSNASFRDNHPNPNNIFPGDKINVPDISVPSPTIKAAPALSDYRMAIIDGTGPSEDLEYGESMRHSFCSQMGDALISQNRGEYWRGPSWHGLEVESSANKAYNYLLKVHHENPKLRLMLAGYSRGGSAAIMVAELLEKKNIEVDALFLFDAVARHKEPGGEVIPKNVLYSRHARRDLKAPLIVKYEGTFSDLEIKGFSLVNGSNPMRPSFGNTGLSWRTREDGRGDHERAVPFPGSHGALGGVGWSFVTEDESCQKRVASWMNAQLKSKGVWHGLKSVRPTPVFQASPGLVELITGWAMDLLLVARHKSQLSKAGPIK